MTKPAIEKPVRRKANPQSNSIAWAVLGAAGLGYLGIAFFAPQILPDFSGGRAHQAETTVAKFSGEIESMQLSLRKLETDMDRVKSDVAAQANQTQSLSSQVSALDEKISIGRAHVWSSDVCSSDLHLRQRQMRRHNSRPQVSRVLPPQAGPTMLPRLLHPRSSTLPASGLQSKPAASTAAAALRSHSVRRS